MKHPAIKMHQDGKSAREIAKALSISTGRVYQIFRANDYKPQDVRPYKGQKVLWTEDEITFIRGNPQMTTTEIANALDRGFSSVKSKRRAIKQHREYSCAVCGDRISQKGKYCTGCNWVERRIAQASYRAKKRDWEYSLPESHAISLVLGSCTYCGGEGGGIDRVDSSKGYTVENAVSCCTTCNSMKLDVPLESWLSHMAKILEKQNG